MKIEKTEYSYQVTECDLKFGEQIVLDGELLISASVLEKIRAEIEQTADEEQKHNKKWAIGLRYAVKIIDKYR